MTSNIHHIREQHKMDKQYPLYHIARTRKGQIYFLYHRTAHNRQEISLQSYTSQQKKRYKGLMLNIFYIEK